MFNIYDITNKNRKEHNLKSPYIPDYPYRIYVIGGSGSGKTNALLSLKKEQDSDSSIDTSYFYAKNVNEPKDYFLI